MMSRLLDAYEEMKQLTRALDGAGVAYALVGGLAVSIYARPRATEDVDLLVAEEDVPRCAHALAALGFQSLARPMSFLEGKVEIRRLTKLAGGDFIVLDLLLAKADELKQILVMRVAVDLEGQKLWLAPVEGLKALKRLRGSPQDLADIAALEEPEKP